VGAQRDKVKSPCSRFAGPGDEDTRFCLEPAESGWMRGDAPELGPGVQSGAPA
jgi:hypothetical protein